MSYIKSFINKFWPLFYIILNGILNRHYAAPCLKQPYCCCTDSYSNVVKNTIVAYFHFVGFTFSFPTEESSSVTLTQAIWFKKVKPTLSMIGKWYKNMSSLSILTEMTSLIHLETRRQNLLGYLRITWSFLPYKLSKQFHSVSLGNLLTTSDGENYVCLLWTGDHLLDDIC